MLAKKNYCLATGQPGHFDMHINLMFVTVLMSFTLGGAARFSAVRWCLCLPHWTIRTTTSDEWLNIDLSENGNILMRLCVCVCVLMLKPVQLPRMRQMSDRIWPKIFNRQPPSQWSSPTQMSRIIIKWNDNIWPGCVIHGTRTDKICTQHTRQTPYYWKISYNLFPFIAI